MLTSSPLICTASEVIKAEEEEEEEGEVGEGVAEVEDLRLYLQHLWKEKSLQLNLSFKQKAGIFCCVVVIVEEVVAGEVTLVVVVISVLVRFVPVGSFSSERFCSDCACKE